MKRLTFFSFLLICAAGIVCSFDFGLVLSQEIEGENKHFAYIPAFTPWFSWDSGKRVSVYISNRFFFEYHNYTDNEPASGWMPQLLTELTYSAINYRIGESVSIEGGRIEYADTIGFAASGLFDGIRFKVDLQKTAINVCLFYTGLLYRETALILMTDNDNENYEKPWNWGDLSACFASRRFLTAARWDMLLEGLTLSAEFLAQFDLNKIDGNQKLNSQYFEAKAAFNPVSTAELSVGALFETMQVGGEGFSGAFGALAGMKMDVPGSIKDMLTVNIKFTTGPWNGDSIAFSPISCVYQGEIFPETLSGLFYPSVDYSVRVHQALFMEGSLRYYISTYSNEAEGNFYGGEIWASFTWQPLNDVRLKVGGGLFLPGLGNVYPDDSDVMWKINAVLTLSL